MYQSKRYRSVVFTLNLFFTVLLIFGSKQKT